MKELLQLFDDCAVCIIDRTTGGIVNASKLFYNYFEDAEGKTYSELFGVSAIPENGDKLTLELKYGVRREFIIGRLDGVSESDELTAVRLIPVRTAESRINAGVIMNVFFKTFFVVYVVNVKDETIRAIYQEADTEKYICGKEPEPFDNVVKIFADEFIFEGDKKRYMKEFSIKSLKEALSDEQRVTYEYRRLIKDKYRFVTYNIQRFSDGDEIVVSVEDKDDTSQKRMAGRDTRRMLTAALRSKYITATLINLSTGACEMLNLKYIKDDSELTRESYDEVVKSYRSLVYPEDRKKFREMFTTENVLRHFKNGEKSVSLEFRYFSNSKYGWYNVTVYNITEEGSDTITGISLVENIDERKQSEAEDIENNSMMSAFCLNYRYAAFVNLADDTMRCIKQSDDISGIEDNIFSLYVKEYAQKAVADGYRENFKKSFDVKQLYDRFLNGEQMVRELYKNDDGKWYSTDAVKTESFSAATPYIIIGVQPIGDWIKKNLDDEMSKIAITKTYIMAVVFSEDMESYHCVHHEMRYLDVPEVGTGNEFCEGLKKITDEENYKKFTDLLVLAHDENGLVSSTLEFISPRKNIHYCEFTATAVEVYGERNIVLLVRNTDGEMTLTSALKESLRLTKSTSDVNKTFLKESEDNIRRPIKSIKGMTALATASVENTQMAMLYLNKIGELADDLEREVVNAFKTDRIKNEEASGAENNFRMTDLLKDVEDRVSYGVSKRLSTFKLNIKNLVHDNLVGDSSRLIQSFVSVVLKAAEYAAVGSTIVLNVEEFNDYIMLDGATSFGFSVEARGKRFVEFARRINDGDIIEFEITKNFIEINGGEAGARISDDSASIFLETQIRLQEVERAEGIDLGDVYVLIGDSNEEECESVGAMLQSAKIENMFATSVNGMVQTYFESKQSGISFEAVIINADADFAADAVQMLRDFSVNTLKFVFMTTKGEKYDFINDKDYVIEKPILNAELVRLFEKVSADRRAEGGSKDKTMKQYRVLFADDDFYIRKLVKKLFSYTKTDVEIVDSGAAAIEAFENNGHFGVVFLDSSLGDMTGLDAAKKIREKSGAVSVIMVDANSFVTHDKEAEKGIVDAHIAKPLNIVKLYKVAHECVIRHKNKKLAK